MTRESSTEAPFKPVTRESTTEAPFDPVTRESTTEAPFEPVTRESTTEAPFDPVTRESTTEAPLDPVTRESTTEAPFDPVTRESTTEAPFEPITPDGTSNSAEPENPSTLYSVSYTPDNGVSTNPRNYSGSNSDTDAIPLTIESLPIDASTITNTEIITRSSKLTPYFVPKVNTGETIFDDDESKSDESLIPEVGTSKPTEMKSEAVTDAQTLPVETTIEAKTMTVSLETEAAPTTQVIPDESTKHIPQDGVEEDLLTAEKETGDSMHS